MVTGSTRWARRIVRIPVNITHRVVVSSRGTGGKDGDMRPDQTDLNSNPGVTRRLHEHEALDLHSANLGSPVFKERWDRGAPLDWTDFLARCRSLRETGPR